MKPNNNKLSRIKMSSVEGPVSSAKKSKRGTKRTPATRNSPRATAAQSPDLAAQVAELQGQLAALRAAVEGRETSVESQERIERPRSRASANPQPTPASSPVESSGYSTGPSHSTLHHAVAAQREGGTAAEQHPSTLGPRPSTQLAALSEQIAELRTQLASVATAAASAPVTSHSPLHHAVAAQREGGPPPSLLDSGPSTPLDALSEQISALRSQFSTLDSRPSTQPQASASLPATAAKPLAVYELKETHPVGYQPSDLLDSSSEESQDGFFTGLLDRARMQWLMGDWEALSRLDLEQIKHHPDRAKLGLLGAIGLMQTGRPTDARNYLAFAKSQGCSSKLIKNTLLIGIHTSMYSANFLNGRENKALRHKSELDRLGVPNIILNDTFSLNRRTPCALGESKDATFEISARIKALTSQVICDQNPTEMSARLLREEDFSPREKFYFLCQLASEFQKIGNKMVASSYLDEASHLLPTDRPADYLWHIVKKLLELGLPEEAFAKRLLIPETHRSLSSDQAIALQKAGKNLLEKIFYFKGHGHELLISISQKYAGRLRTQCAERKPVFIEIGTTRESASGQGSTRRLAEMCHREKFHFITVDMDRACTDMAKQMFLENGFPFEAIHSKGEEFLANYSGPIDGIFLDAYDFDHGKHIEFRQSRYEKFLGSRISELDCHRMHLDCALQIIQKACPWTLVCVDDTWLHFGRWTAKGTLAIPRFLENGYHLLDVRNKAVLMGSSYWLEKIQPALPY